MVSERFADMLAEGRANSLGRVVEVVEAVLADQPRLGELFDCWLGDDEWVRLRAANAVKRVAAEQPAWLDPYLEVLLDKVAALDQPSAKWTVAQLVGRLEARLSDDQRARATARLKAYLERADDWIVLNESMRTLGAWSRSDPALAAWLRPQLERLAADPRTSVSRRATRLLAA